MCLILFALDQHPDYPLIVAANRDEFFERPTKAAHYWNEASHIFAGRDLQAGGTWMGISTSGRFAAVTNYRSPMLPPGQAISRGELCSNFLNSALSAEEFLADIHNKNERYAGFNLLVGDKNAMYYYANHQPSVTKLKAGFHGLSNGALNEQWPKVSSGIVALKKSLQASPEPENVLPILLDSQPAPISEVPNTGIDREAEIALSSRFIKPIRTSSYGTRNCTVLRMDINGNFVWLEQGFDQSGPINQPVKHHISGV